MLRKIILCLIFALPAVSGWSTSKPEYSDLHIVGSSQEKFEKLFDEGMNKGYFFYEKLTRDMLPAFQGIPYGAGGPGCPGDKTLVNFHSFDCVTFVETFWALSYTLYEFQSGEFHKGDDPFLVFGKNLNKIRYFGGENCGMEYRIHYFTQQMEELERRGLVFNVAMSNGFPFTKKINYISSNSDQYGDFAAEGKQKSIEKVLNQTPRFYYPKSKRDYYYPLAKNGDIVAFATTEQGLDVSHVGIVTIKDGKVKLNHSSMAYDKVVLDNDLDQYLRGRTTVNGFFIYRPRFDIIRKRKS